jgi:hypothetical protein
MNSATVTWRIPVALGEGADEARIEGEEMSKGEGTTATQSSHLASLSLGASSSRMAARGQPRVAVSREKIDPAVADRLNSVRAWSMVA